jgi:uncharacterized protein (UPF0297 family)
MMQKQYKDLKEEKTIKVNKNIEYLSEETPNYITTTTEAKINIKNVRIIKLLYNRKILILKQNLKNQIFKI